MKSNSILKMFFFLLCFAFMSTAAMAQTPQDRATYMSNKMDSLFVPINLTQEQRDALYEANLEYYQIRENFKNELAQDPEYQQALANNFQSPAGQAILEEIQKRRTQQERDYLQSVANVVFEQGFELFKPAKEALQQEVILVFGE